MQRKTERKMEARNEREKKKMEAEKEGKGDKHVTQDGDLKTDRNEECDEERGKKGRNISLVRKLKKWRKMLREERKEGKKGRRRDRRIKWWGLGKIDAMI